MTEQPPMTEQPMTEQPRRPSSPDDRAAPMTEQDDAEQDGTAGTRGDPAALPAIAPERAPDDTDEGWGERRSGEDRDDDWYERERPPHW